MSLYAGSYHKRDIKKYRTSDLEKVATSPDYGGYVLAIVGDSDYIYAGGVTTNKIRKYNKLDLSYVSQSGSFAGGISQLIIDNDCIYVSASGILYKCQKSDLSIIATGGSYRTKMAVDDKNVYAGGLIENGRIRKYDKSDLSYLAQAPEYMGAGGALVADSIYIYSGITGGRTDRAIWKLRKSDLVKVAESPDDSFDSYSMIQDTNYIYACGWGASSRVYKYLKSNMSKVGESGDLGGTLHALTQDVDYIYASGGWTDDVALWKLNRLGLGMVTSGGLADGMLSSLWADLTIEGYIGSSQIID